jgi:hypothetical protein
MKPARTVVNRSPHRQVGLLASGSPDTAQVDHESHLESGFVQVVRVLREVKRIQAQPFRMEGLPAHLDRLSYVPDYLVELNDGHRCVFEIKPERFIEKDRDLFNWAAKTLARSGTSFFVVTNQLLGNKRLEAAALIRRFKKAALPSELIEKALDIATPSITWKEASQSAIPSYVWLGLVGRHALLADTIDFTSTADARLYSQPEESEHDHQIRLCNWLGCSPWRTNI